MAEKLYLHQLKRDSGVILRLPICGDADKDCVMTDVEFGHIDGMYSYCTVRGGPYDGKVVHLAAMAPLKKVEDGKYEIDD